ncbi:hypothetical protein NHX12_019930 [Muraenolepis orangiensis]|uniref:Uncharacterized protein n=1 Tax=Muraenolepis orangiensis TaxID=630683 RepID=A0A9Q0EUW7_9TELE|nr:hypothetical protein NHX12_019930 [Muraenolepis orangiensis]
MDGYGPWTLVVVTVHPVSSPGSLQGDISDVIAMLANRVAPGSRQGCRRNPKALFSLFFFFFCLLNAGTLSGFTLPRRHIVVKPTGPTEPYRPPDPYRVQTPIAPTDL